MEKNVSINTEIYDTLGDRWYSAHDDPVALLRSQSLVIGPWVIEKIQKHFGQSRDVKILDVGCGGGFLSNRLAVEKYQVVGLDLSAESLEVARKHDQTQSVEYHQGDALHLPFADGSFQVVTAMDFLEHIDEPQKFITEVSRVLRPGGLFIYHTFNRNFLSRLVIIKFVEWFIKNTPSDLHLYSLFIKPEELKNYCLAANLQVVENVGIRPLFSTASLRDFLKRTVPEKFRFTLTPSLRLSYMGYAQKT